MVNIKFSKLVIISNCQNSFELIIQSFVMLCTVWYHLYNLKNVKNTRGVVLLLVKLQAKLVPLYHHINKLSQKSVTIVVSYFCCLINNHLELGYFENFFQGLF